MCKVVQPEEKSRMRKVQHIRNGFEVRTLTIHILGLGPKISSFLTIPNKTNYSTQSARRQFL